MWYKIPITKNIKNTLSIGLLGFITTSSIMCLSKNRDLCLNKYNLDEDRLDFSLIIQQIIYKIDVVSLYLCMNLGFCWIYGIKFSFSGYLVACLIIIIMGLVTPPIPGGAIAVCSSLFAMLGLPAKAMAIFVSVDIFLDMIGTGTKTMLISDELLSIDRKSNSANK